MLQFFTTYLHGLRDRRTLLAAAIVLRVVSGILEVAGLLYFLSWLGRHIGTPAGGGVPAAGARGSAWFSFLLPLEQHVSPAILFLFMGVVAVVLKEVSRGLSYLLAVHAEQKYRDDVFMAIVGMRWEAFLGTRVGKLQELLLGRGHQIMYASRLFIDFLSEGLTAFVYVLAGAMVSPGMTAAIGLFFLIIYFCFSGMKERSANLTRVLLKLGKDLANQTEEVLGHLKLVRGQGLDSLAAEQFRVFQRRARRLHAISYLSRTAPDAVMEGTAVLFIALLALATVNWGLVEFGAAMGFLALFYRLAPRLRAAVSHYMHARSSEPVVHDTILAVRQCQADQETTRGAKKVIYTREVIFDNVSFAFRNARHHFQLTDISFTIPRGKCVALVGPSGEGKTTLIDLLVGLLRPTRGRILVDGVDLWQLDPSTWGRQLGLVLQDSPLFHTTLLENVAWGDRRPDPERARRALQLANLGGFVASLPEGIDTLVGQKGLRLSGGQRQRVALARALYRNPALLILDEATSSLDSFSEAALQEELVRLKGQFSILMVAHRLKTVEMADEILVLEGGRIRERGSWSSLLADGRSQFARMAAQQGIRASGAVSPAPPRLPRPAPSP